MLPSVLSESSQGIVLMKSGYLPGQSTVERNPLIPTEMKENTLPALPNPVNLTHLTITGSSLIATLTNSPLMTSCSTRFRQCFHLNYRWDASRAVEPAGISWYHDYRLRRRPRVPRCLWWWGGVSRRRATWRSPSRSRDPSCTGWSSGPPGNPAWRDPPTRTQWRACSWYRIYPCGIFHR